MWLRSRLRWLGQVGGRSHSQAACIQNSTQAQSSSLYGCLCGVLLDRLPCLLQTLFLLWRLFTLTLYSKAVLRSYYSCTVRTLRSSAVRFFKTVLLSVHVYTVALRRNESRFVTDSCSVTVSVAIRSYILACTVHMCHASGPLFSTACQLHLQYSRRQQR